MHVTFGYRLHVIIEAMSKREKGNVVERECERGRVERVKTCRAIGLQVSTTERELQRGRERERENTMRQR